MVELAVRAVQLQDHIQSTPLTTIILMFIMCTNWCTSAKMEKDRDMNVEYHLVL